MENFLKRGLPLLFRRVGEEGDGYEEEREWGSTVRHHERERARQTPACALPVRAVRVWDIPSTTDRAVWTSRIVRIYGYASIIPGTVHVLVIPGCSPATSIPFVQLKECQDTIHKVNVHKVLANGGEPSLRWETHSRGQVQDF